MSLRQRSASKPGTTIPCCGGAVTVYHIHLHVIGGRRHDRPLDKHGMMMTALPLR